MGFEINGMPVLTNAHGFVNETNTFRTLKGNSIKGSGNISDTGSDCLEYNKVGSFTVASYNLYYTIPYRTTQNYGWLTNVDIVPADELKVRYWSSYGGYAVSFYTASTNSDGSSFTFLSGSWRMKNMTYGVPGGGLNKPTLWQRVA